MAEKEERIWIGTTEKKIQLKQMTRTEAIDRMAKALCADDVMREGYYQMAEAALNALLKGE